MDCPFCKEFETKHRIVFESDNFIVIPSLGQIVEGHVMIIPKQHHISISNIPASLYPELEKVQQTVKKILKNVYEDVFFFEHGPASKTKRGGCCVEHAHLHAIPLSFDILNDIAKYFSYKKIEYYEDFKEHSDKPYIFLEDTKGIRYLFSIPDVIPSQYVRRIIALKINKPNSWDWKNDLKIDQMNKNVIKLRREFENGR